MRRIFFVASFVCICAQTHTPREMISFAGPGRDETTARRRLLDTGPMVLAAARLLPFRCRQGSPAPPLNLPQSLARPILEIVGRGARQDLALRRGTLT